MLTSHSFREILAPNADWYPNQWNVKWGNKHNLHGDIPIEFIEKYLDGLDVLFAMETPYDYNIFKLCRKRGIKIILQPNYEFLDFPSNSLTSPDLFAMPSIWNIDNVPEFTGASEHETLHVRKKRKDIHPYSWPPCGS
jgi:hypothetical protein